jgi:hypothetical protein
MDLSSQEALKGDKVIHYEPLVPEPVKHKVSKIVLKYPKLDVLKSRNN